MMVKIEHPHGYLLDSDGHVILLFANWETAEHSVPDATASVEYVDGPAAHDRDIHDDYRDDTS